MTTHEKQNFLRVAFDRYRGLKLQWNFKDLMAKERYFRHIFVICTDKDLEIESMLDSFYKKMKSGDLFCCIFPHDTYIYKVGKWVEKTQINVFKPKKYLRQKSTRTLQNSIKSKLIDGAGKEAVKFEEAVIINFLIGEEKQCQFYKNQIKRHRSSLLSNYQYIANIFGNFQQNRVSIHSGINQFKSNTLHFQQYAQYYHKFINSAVVKTAKVSIQSLNGQLSLFNEVYWRNADFNRIQALYYGPSSQYEYDSIYFYNHDQSVDAQHDFQIRLQIKLFSLKILESVKRIKISFYVDKEYYPTFQMTRYNSFYPQKNICLSENPYKCQVIVKYKNTKQKEEEQENQV